MFTLEEVRRTFDSWAPRYNATHASRLLKRHVARLALGVRPGDRVIEIACGTGLNFAHLRDLVGDEGRVVGVDISPAMLEIAGGEIALNIIPEHERAIAEVRRAFPAVDVRRYLGGALFIAVADKNRPPF